MQTTIDLHAKYNATVDAFAAEMKREMLANDTKGDWAGAPVLTLILDIFHHAAKLHAAHRAGNLDGIREYAADTANCCMMAADLAGALHVREVVNARA